MKNNKSTKNNKSPGNEEITKEFYDCIWDYIKNLLSNSIKKSFISVELPTFQKLIEKKKTDAIS